MDGMHSLSSAAEYYRSMPLWHGDALVYTFQILRPSVTRSSLPLL